MSFWHEAITLLLGTVAGLGVGSGGIYLLWLKEGMGYEGTEAVFLNLLFFCAALLTAAAIHARAKRLDYSFLAEIVLFGIPGALVGRWLNRFFPPAILKLFLGVFLIFSGVFSLVVTKKKKENTKETLHALDKKEKQDYNE